MPTDDTSSPTDPMPESATDRPPAPRRRRATSAAAAPPEAVAPESVTSEAAASAGSAAPPAKRVRKAPAKKAVAAAADPGAPADPDAPAGEPAAPAAPAAPAKAPRKRAAKATAPALPADPAPDGDGAAEAAPTPRRRRAATAAVTFQPPTLETPSADPFSAATPTAAPDDEAESASAPRRRRRAGTAGAIAPAAFLAPEPVADDALAPSPGATGAALDDDEDPDGDGPRRRRRGRRGRGGRPEGDDAPSGEGTTEDAPGAGDSAKDDEDDEDGPTGTRRRRRRRRRGGSGAGEEGSETTDGPAAPRAPREPRAPRARGDRSTEADEDGVRGITGSTRMAAKRARRQEGRDSGRRRAPVVTEAEFLARREAVERTMIVRQQGDRTQIAVLEDGILVEHYVTRASAQSYAGNVYLGKVQNVLPSMEAAFVDIGKGRNAVLYAGEVNYDAGLVGGSGPRKIEQALKSGQEVLVQVTKDPMGHKGARLTSQVSLPGRYIVYVPQGSMTGISRKLPEEERNRLKAILRASLPEDAGVIIRTAAEGASEEEIAGDVRRLQAQWEVIQTKAAKGGGPVLLHAEPDLVIRVVRDVFNEDFTSLVVQGESEWDTIRDYVEFVAPDLAPRLSRHEGDADVFRAHRVDEQLAKALDRKVHLPSGGSLVIDRTEAMVVIDVNTGKFVGKGGNLEETVTRNNLEAAEEIARQLRLRDLGGIIVVDFIDMVLESNRDLVVRRLVECLARDRTKHQVAEVTSLGLVQMTRKRVGQGLLESFSEPCEHCSGRGVLVQSEPVDERPSNGSDRDRGRDGEPAKERGRGRERSAKPAKQAAAPAAAPRAPKAAPTPTPEPAATEAAEAPAKATAEEPAAAFAEILAQGAGVPAGETPANGVAADPPVRRRRRATSRPAGPPA